MSSPQDGDGGADGPVIKTKLTVRGVLHYHYPDGTVIDQPFVGNVTEEGEHDHHPEQCVQDRLP